ncbi:heparan-alpha-glucosaminide N-acetyltransferase domain-containing protein [Methylobacterium sp. 1030]|uniref:DUF1624 domain-containing protein n=1 Tax=Methylobacterium sp. 1030 TaxID=3156404 RepID=UPI00339B4917
MGVHPGILEATAEESARTGRIAFIDALRGLVMVLMLLDHLRETWFLHVPVADPMDARTAMPALYLARLAVSLCAPIFIVLTGVAAYLFSTRHTLGETRAYLVKRGLVLIAFEVFYLSELYWGVASPTLWLQVIWCIGVCMIVLAALIGLPRSFLLAFGMLLVCGHNLLDPIQLRPDDSFFAVWAMLHQRDVIALPFGLVAKTTYPVLPWIGVILLGYAIGPWFLPGVAAGTRERRFAAAGITMLAGFALLRLANGYGDKPWFVVDDSAMRTAMSFFALTKYPPSLLFLLLTLGIGALLLVVLERLGDRPAVAALAVFGGAPLFFYLLHLTVVRLLYHGAFAIWGATQNTVFGIDNYVWVVVWYAVLMPPLYFPTAWFSRLRASRRDLAWLKYL